MGGHIEYMQYYTQIMIPEVAAMTATTFLPLIGKRRQEAILKDAIQKIAEIEGRIPSTYREEGQRAGFISFYLAPLLDDLPYNLIKKDLNPQALRRVRPVMDQIMDQIINVQFSFFDKTSKNGTDLSQVALELGEYYWGEVADDQQQPDYRRMYAYKKIAAIRQRLRS